MLSNQQRDAFNLRQKKNIKGASVSVVFFLRSLLFSSLPSSFSHPLLFLIPFTLVPSVHSSCLSTREVRPACHCDAALLFFISFHSTFAATIFCASILSSSCTLTIHDLLSFLVSSNPSVCLGHPFSTIDGKKPNSPSCMGCGMFSGKCNNVTKLINIHFLLILSFQDAKSVSPLTRSPPESSSSAMAST